MSTVNVVAYAADIKRQVIMPTVAAVQKRLFTIVSSH
jgi:hypothetical protein